MEHDKRDTQYFVLLKPAGTVECSQRTNNVMITVLRLATLLQSRMSCSGSPDTATSTAPLQWGRPGRTESRLNSGAVELLGWHVPCKSVEPALDKAIKFLYRTGAAGIVMKL